MKRIYELRSCKRILNTKKDRYVFDIENVGTVSAAGFMLRNGNNYLMQIHSDMPWMYDDFGGKTDLYDKDVFDTVMREVCEESNSYLNVSREELMAAEKYYIPSSKYLLFVADTTKDYAEVIELMGDYEEWDDCPRTTGWVHESIHEYCHPRLKGFFASSCVI